ncbi:MAG: type II toxin-antitoxin system YafQ family toxin [Kiritimatiellaeota bacterium]|nr:type II toxin-antitoxin system YafQ family toxin [Kiritimatiellota bacterium]
MKHGIVRTSRFKKEYKLMQRRGMDMELLHRVIEQLAQGKPLSEKHRDHALTGNFAGTRECHVKPDWLLVYQIEKSILVLTLIRTGTHSDLL